MPASNTHRADRLVEKLRALPPERLEEVEDFVDFLRTRSADRQSTRKWAGASEQAFERIWDNDEDAAYDEL
ncbi:MAG: toxin-antitoxin system, antitoxin component, Xre family protein [Myxococcota bacterium]